MKQSRVDSAMETVTNTAIGFVIAVVSNAIILPLTLGVQVSMGDSVFIAVLFTLVSMVRQYSLRRLFNGRSVWQAIKSKLPCPACKGSGIVQTYDVVMGSFEDPCARCN